MEDEERKTTDGESVGREKVKKGKRITVDKERSNL